MRDETKGEEQVTKHYGTLTSESENDMDFIFHFNGPDMKNPYANYRLTGHSHLSFTAETGKVTATYIDDEGNKLTEDIINTGKVNDEYKTNEKEFQYYKLIEIQGNETGIYKSEEQIVTYVYTFVGGTGGDIVEDINFPKTGVSTNNIPEVIFVSSTLLLLITILFKKKFI